MKQLTQKMKTGELSLLEVPKPIIHERAVLVKNQYSVISAGTEKSKIDLGKKSLLQKAKARPDLVKQVLQKIKTEGLFQTYQTVKNKLEEETPLGYSSAGIVVEAGLEVEGLQPGDRVACGGAGYANHAEYVAVPKNLVVKVPEKVSLEQAAFTTIGSIALQGVRLAAPLLGEKFLVIVLGLVGQITAQLLKANGCQVIGYDPEQTKVEFAKKYQIEGCHEAEAIKNIIDKFTHEIGVDGVLICAGTSSNQPIEMAAEVCRSKGRVVIVGAVGMQVPREPYFKKEISLVVSRSYGPGRYDPQYEEAGIDYPIDYVRFTEKRNMESFLELLAEEKINVTELITHRFLFAEAITAYGLIEGKATETYLGILLQYPSQPEIKAFSASKEIARSLADKINLSVIGAGNYATTKLLPILAQDEHVKLQCLMTASGRSAATLVKKFNFSNAVGNVEEVLLPHSNVVLIATRHHSHAALVCQSLQAGKHVFVEKPLALTKEELIRIYQQLMTMPQLQLMVGFNRRFAPLTQKVNEFFENTITPKVINIRVNAGLIEASHWINDPHIGGGRILGEACHFVDLASALANSLPIALSAYGTAGSKSALLNDNVVVNIRFANGSIATLTYTASGSKLMPKEYIEIFAGGKSALINDFCEAVLFSGQQSKKIKLRQQNKGQKQMLEAWLQGIMTGYPCLNNETLLVNSLATLAIVESLAKGKEISIDLKDLTSE